MGKNWQLKSGGNAWMMIVTETHVDKEFAPVAVEAVPAGQLLQEPIPSPGPKVPLGQIRHCEPLVAPGYGP